MHSVGKVLCLAFEAIFDGGITTGSMLLILLLRSAVLLGGHGFWSESIEFYAMDGLMCSNARTFGWVNTVSGPIFFPVLSLRPG